MIPNSSLRVVIDTNIWISFLIGKHLSKLQEALIDEKVIILFSEELFEELLAVLQRPKFRRYFSSAAIRELTMLLSTKIEWVKVSESFSDCRDLKDNFLLDLSVSGNADYLVTGDMDLLVLDPFHNTRIVNYRFFESVLVHYSEE